MFEIPPAESDEPMPTVAASGSAAEASGEETLGLAVDIPWDTYLGVGAAERIRDGSLGVVRHAYPATAALDMRAAATATGQLLGDAATHERVAAIAVRVAAVRHRPGRMPHRAGDEPHAWWIAEERTLVWLPWADIDEAPYGMSLLDNREADTVQVLAPDAVWTIFISGLPARGTKGTWDDLPDRVRQALRARVGSDLAGARWRRDADTIVVRWKDAERVRSASIEVNRFRYTATVGTRAPE